MYLTALPVFNEVGHVEDVLREVLEHADRVLVVDDGSTDGTSERLVAFVAAAPAGRARVVRHPSNRGYGAALATAFAETLAGDWDGLVTIDCDGQHQPRLIPRFVKAAKDPTVAADIVSGSRFLEPTLSPTGVTPPVERRRVNETITAELNRRLGLSLTDAFCGFKAYRTAAMRGLALDVDGYDFPMQFWVQACAAGLRLEELAVRRIYVDMTRTFGSGLDVPDRRLAVYRETMHREIRRCARRLPVRAMDGIA